MQNQPPPTPPPTQNRNLQFWKVPEKSRSRKKVGFRQTSTENEKSVLRRPTPTPTPKNLRLRWRWRFNSEIKKFGILPKIKPSSFGTDSIDLVWLVICNLLLNGLVTCKFQLVLVRKTPSWYFRLWWCSYSHRQAKTCRESRRLFPSEVENKVLGFLWHWSSSDVQFRAWQ